MIRIYRSSDKTVVSKCVLLFDWNHPISEGGSDLFRILQQNLGEIALAQWFSLAGFARRHASSSATGSNLHRPHPLKIHWNCRQILGSSWENPATSSPTSKELDLESSETFTGAQESETTHETRHIFHLRLCLKLGYTGIPWYTPKMIKTAMSAMLISRKMMMIQWI